MKSLILLPLLILAKPAHITVGLVDASNFCLMLPPTLTKTNVGDTEGDSVAKCLGTVPGSDPMTDIPPGFILSGHVIKTNDYIQITGSFDRVPLNFSAKDDGGQIDDWIHGSRPGSSCAGYAHYLQYVEPNAGDQGQGHYCLRCCSPNGDCSAAFDEQGCAFRMKGLYGPGFTFDDQCSGSTTQLDPFESSSESATTTHHPKPKKTTSSSFAETTTSESIVSTSTRIPSSSTLTRPSFLFLFLMSLFI